jgi:tRNA (Thr-GGU) A37 N-methylase
MLVPSARSVLELLPEIPDCIFEGLEEFSHCWILYAFHLNTGAHLSSGRSMHVLHSNLECSGSGRWKSFQESAIALQTCIR